MTDGGGAASLIAAAANAAAAATAAAAAETWRRRLQVGPPLFLFPSGGGEPRSGFPLPSLT